MSLNKAITNSGLHKSFIISRFRSVEQEILKRLANWWYLTNSGKDVAYGNNDPMSYFLIKPTSSFAEGFNLDREIITVFSHYQKFEPRTLDVFDDAAKDYQTLRVETVCRILISGDPDIENKINDLLKNDPESPIVIPFTYDELSSCDEDFIKNRFRKHFYSRDLFDFLSPLKRDLYFFGRSELILEQINRHSSGEHSGLFGLRKSGKTSIIYAIERRLSSIGSKFLSLDCESPSVHKLRWNELLFSVATKYHKNHESKLKPPKEKYYDEKSCADQFESDILNIYKSKKAQSTVFIFDEIERISPDTASSEHWRSGNDFVYFWQTMRAFYQRNPGIFTYLLVGTNPKCVESPILNGHENPLFKSVPSLYVPSFDVTKVREMVRKLGRYMGLKFDEQVYALLCDDFGGHPFLIRQFCSELNKRTSSDRPQVIGKPKYQSVKREAESALSEYLGMILTVLHEHYEEEYDLLRMLAAEDFDSFHEFAKNDPNLVKHLLGYGIIQRQGDAYAFNIESIKAFVSNKHRFESISLSQEEKLSEISKRRNNLESRLREVAYKVLTIAVGKEKVQGVVLSALASERKNKLSGLSGDELLDRDKSVLFFLELIEVINKNWESFKNIFSARKEKVISALRDINEIGRPDCHAKIVEKDEFQQLRLHFSFLEEQIKNW